MSLELSFTFRTEQQRFIAKVEKICEENETKNDQDECVPKSSAIEPSSEPDYEFGDYGLPSPFGISSDYFILENETVPDFIEEAETTTETIETSTESSETLTESSETFTESSETFIESFETSTESFETSTESFEISTKSVGNSIESFNLSSESPETTTEAFESSTESFETSTYFIE